MIGYIKGKIVFISEDMAIILTSSGVGYEVTVPKPMLIDKNFLKKEQVELYIKTVVREDSIELFGFETMEQKDLFNKLIQVTKLGPKTAINILSKLSPDEFIEAIFNENIIKLTQIPGIGKKTAKRIILELKEKLEKTHGINNLYIKPKRIDNQKYLDVLSALKNLGYKDEEVDSLIKQEIEQEPDLLIEEIIRNILKRLAKKHE
ncbi:Holliday junction branch migration protein RuvA [Desulfothermus sp.]